MRAFGRLVERGLVYQSKKPVYWSTGARTALAEAEVEYHEEDAPAIYVKFPLTSGPLAGQASIVIWTTTPWTLPANQAIAVNPGFGYRAQVLPQPAHGQSGNARCSPTRSSKSFCKATGYTPRATDAADDGRRASSARELEGWTYRHPFLDARGAGDPGRVRHAGRRHGLRPHRPRPRQRGLRRRAASTAWPCSRPWTTTASSPRRCGVPALVGKYVFDANPDVIAMLREPRRAGGRGHDPPHLPALLALEGADHLPRGGAILHPHGRPAPRGAARHRRGEMDSATGAATASTARSRIAPGLVHLAPAHLGRAAARVLRRGRQAASCAATGSTRSPTSSSTRHEHLVRPAGHDSSPTRSTCPPGTTRRNDTLDVWIDSGVSCRPSSRR